MATITEIAKKANVSKTLVSRLLNGDPTLRIAPETHDRVLAVHDKMGGIKRNRLSVGRKKNLSCNIVFPVNGNYASEWSELGNLSSSPFVRSLRLFLKSRGFRLSFGHFNPAELKDEIADYVQSPEYCDGLFLYYGVVDASVAKVILEHKFPHVSSDFRAERFGVNTVSAYIAGAYRQAIIHLQQLGHERIGYVGPIGSIKENVYWYPAFAAALAENYVPNNPENHCGLPVFPSNQTPTEEWISKAKVTMRQWLEKGPLATAVICKKDYIAQCLVEVMREMGLEPGRDLSVIGHGNIEVRGPKPAEKPILTTIDNPEEAIALRCGESLLMQIQEKFHDIVYEHIPVGLIIRETTGPCRK